MHISNHTQTHTRMHLYAYETYVHTRDCPYKYSPIQTFDYGNGKCIFAVRT